MVTLTKNPAKARGSDVPFMKFSPHQESCILALYEEIKDENATVDRGRAINALYKAFTAFYFPPYTNDAVSDTFYEPVIRFWATKFLGKDGKSYIPVWGIPVVLAKVQCSFRLRAYYLAFRTREIGKNEEIRIGGFVDTIGNDQDWFQ